MTKNDDKVLEIARHHWDRSEALAAGRLIFESLPPEVRSPWAINILNFVRNAQRLKIRSIERLVGVAFHPENWKSIKPLFSEIRNETLQLEQRPTRSRDEELVLCQLYLAENVAKVIYNATGPMDEFDDDSGWWIAKCLKCCVDQVGDEQFAKAAWSVLSDKNQTLERYWSQQKGSGPEK